MCVKCWNKNKSGTEIRSMSFIVFVVDDECYCLVVCSSLFLMMFGDSLSIRE